MKSTKSTKGNFSVRKGKAAISMKPVKVPNSFCAFVDDLCDGFNRIDVAGHHFKLDSLTNSLVA